jgi:hypothetical protein
VVAVGLGLEHEFLARLQRIAARLVPAQRHSDRKRLRKRTQTFKRVRPEEFIAQRNKSKRSQFLSPLNPDEIRNHYLFTNHNGTVGTAVSPEGDIQNLFNNSGIKGLGTRAMAHAIESGGRTLDAFDPYLPKLYRQFGFRETSRMKFDRDFAPEGWNYAQDDDPDVVFMG